MSAIIDAEEFHDLIVITPDFIRNAVDLSARAYAENPLTDGVFDGHATQRQLATFWRANLLSLMSDMLILTDSDEMNMLAAVGLASFKGVSALRFIFNGGYKILGYAAKMIKYDKYATEQRHKVCHGDEIYLYDLAIRPSMQGHGLASKILKPLTQVADRLKRPIFLETHDASTLPIYEHYNFQKAIVGQVPDSNLTHFALLRQPAGIVTIKPTV